MLVQASSANVQMKTDGTTGSGYELVACTKIKARYELSLVFQIPWVRIGFKQPTFTPDLGGFWKTRVRMGLVTGASVLRFNEVFCQHPGHNLGSIER